MRVLQLDGRSSDPLPESGWSLDLEVERASENASVFQLVSAVLSNGLLVMPFAFKVGRLAAV